MAAVVVGALLVRLATGGFGTVLPLPFLSLSEGADGVVRGLDLGSGRFSLSDTPLIFPSVASGDQLNQESSTEDQEIRRHFFLRS